jgi:hypothetical protein
MSMSAGFIAEITLIILITFLLPFIFRLGFERITRARSQRLPRPGERRHFEWVRTERNRAIRLPQDADLGKIDPVPDEPAQVDSSIEINGNSFKLESPERRVTRAEFDEMMPQPNTMWARIGAQRKDASMRSDDKPADDFT